MDLQILYNNPRRKKHSVKKNPGLNRRRSLRGMFRRNPSQDELSPALPASLRSKPKVSSTFKKTMDDYLKTRKVKESEVKEEKKKKASKKKASKKKASKKKAAKKAAKKVMKKVAKKTKKKVVKKVVKKAKKKVAKKAMKKSYKKKAAKKVAKKVAKKAKRKNKKKVVKKSNLVTKIRTKKARKKSARKAARTRAKNKAKKVLARKKAAKKAVRTRKRLKKAGYKKVDKEKLKALKKKLKDKRFKAKSNPSYKKTKHKRKSNPFGGAMKKFKEVTKHEIKEAGGLFAGGALIKVYDYHLKQRFLAPMLQPIMSKLGAAAPAADAIIDVLASVLIGQGLSFVGKKAKIDALDLVGKGLIGASVVQLGIKTVSSASAAVGMPMNGIIGVPSMSGIIGVPSMNGIIGVPSMGGMGRMSADFQGMGASGMQDSDFGAYYKTVGLEGSYLQAADYDSGSVIPTAPRTPEAFAGYENVEYSDEGEDGDF
jgi:hypothetical protein